MTRWQNTGRVLFCLFLIGWVPALSQARYLTEHQAKKKPRARIACVPSPTMGVRYLDASDLGPHGYRSNRGERNGIAYTCHGGHVDVTHLRKIADWTAYLACRTRQALVRGDREFKFRMFEPSVHHVTLKYPPGWKYLGPEARDAIAGEVCISLGAYLAYTCSVWHEILTWHGFKAIGFYPEYNSAFSWEDNYSNALGSYIGTQALRDRDHSYDEAMALLIEREFQRLCPQPKEVAIAAGETVKDSWFVGAFIRVTMVKRHLDVGLDDGFVTPWLVPDIAECGTPEPWLCPVPDLNEVEAYGFHVHHEIHPREWERFEILRAIYPNPRERRNCVIPTEHFDRVLEYVQAKVNKRYGPYAHLRETPPLEASIPQTAQAPPSMVDNRAKPAQDLGGTACVRTAGFEPPSDSTDEGQRHGLFEMLGSAVSWLTGDAL